MSQPQIRVLHMIGSLCIGGSQAMVMNIYRNIDRSKVQFDFIIDNPADPFFKDEILSMGGKVYQLPKFNGKNYRVVRNAWNEFLTKHDGYKVLHSHVRSYASLYLPIAKAYGLKTIMHSHSTSNGKGVVSLGKKILQLPLRYQADWMFGCSDASGKWLFGDNVLGKSNYKTISNAISVLDFKYDLNKRSALRDDYKLGDALVLGHIGTFREAKNHKFLLEIVSDLSKVSKRSVKLVLVGSGELEQEIRDYVNILGIENNVLFLGSRNDTADLMQMMDIFLFPSKWEGLPVTIVEVQAAGLPCFLSDTITREVDFGHHIQYLSINDGTDTWVNAILNSDMTRYDATKDIKAAGFDIQEAANWFQDFYLGLNDDN